MKALPIDQDFLDAPITNIEQIFDVLKLSKSGRTLLHEFLPKYYSNEITIQKLTPEELKKNFEIPKTNTKTFAGFVYDGKRKVIYLNFDMPIGRTIPILIHEITHSLDQNYIESYHYSKQLSEKLKRRGKEILVKASKKSEKPLEDVETLDCDPKEIQELQFLKNEFERHDQQRTFDAERVAYSKQYEVVSELMENLQAFREYSEKHTEFEGLFKHHPTNADIIRKYHLNKIS